MVIGTAYSNNVAFHGFWSVIPTFVCFMPTAGATLVKGNYRIIGTFLGACMAIVCVAINPHNKPAWFCELLLLMFSAKLVSLYEPIWYAGWMYSLTWHIVGFSSVHAPLSDDTMMKQAAWRFIFTFGGTLATTFFSACFFPDMASRKLRRISADTLVEISKKLSKSLDDMARTKSAASESIGRRWMVTDASSSSSSSESSSLYSEEVVLNLGIFKNVTTMHSLAADAKSEVVVYGKIPHAVSRVSKTVLREKESIVQVVKYSVSLYNSVLVTSLASHPILGDSDSFNQFSRFLRPMWKKVSQFSEALRVSGGRMNDRLIGGAVDDGQGMPDDIHVTIQQFIDNFLDIRKRFLTTVLEKGEIPASLRTEQCFQLYHTFYALGKFAEKWNALEGSLLARQVPPSGESTTLAAIEAAEKEKAEGSKDNHTESEQTSDY
ncbi:hypothetical protein Pmar_PMAR014546 [Perkinsus marinus ATCC 50983]|uniref:DUF2421 domain-containing protein n=1 Tax=Perkinsus marinus (strain ATCC 50983 / TXsc) TaxID=423536 RepID=C5KWD4_PERM5|nr:hypothetical protein Pmar_PMAR014546 [Perkinsus marinus ATCC 50983]EER11245.1 hypothetical protein Pmar_PMAR014546 [Perkinsus marinus ATCC 50983]|eukprot:XP_002779450.1 hypothetical protein Pmar_PMAR014546 [Perkinsus marinus ATCC 50983]